MTDRPRPAIELMKCIGFSVGVVVSLPLLVIVFGVIMVWQLLSSVWDEYLTLGRFTL